VISFDLLIEDILVDIENPLTSGSHFFGENWTEISTFPKKWSSHERDHADLNKKLINSMMDSNSNGTFVVKLMNIFLLTSNYGRSSNLASLQQAVLRKVPGNHSVKQEVILNVDFDKDLQGLSPDFSMKQNYRRSASPSTSLPSCNPGAPNDLGILVLDDVLIGLDMSNRLPVIDILHDHFLSNIKPITKYSYLL